MNTIGVDVDSRHLVCQIRRGDENPSNRQFANTDSGFQQFISWATAGQQQARVCLEATGVYSLAFSLALHAHPQIEVMVVNPKAIKHFATACLSRGKTDQMDAMIIREYLERMAFRAWQPPALAVLELQRISRRTVQLQREHTREDNRYQAAKRLGSVGTFIANDIAVNMRHIQRRIAVLERAALELVHKHETLEHQLRLLRSITGIAEKTGPRILAELSALPADMTASQWVAYAGLDPRPHQSGSSTHKPNRVSKHGNSYLRNALYFPALVASRHDPNVRAFHQKLISKGKKPMQVIIAIMRKLLMAIWGMLHSNQPWDGSKFYRIA